MKLNGFIVNKVPDVSNSNQIFESTCDLSYFYDLQDSTLYIYAYQDINMGKFGWLNIHLEGTINRAIEEIKKTLPDNRNCFQKLLGKENHFYNKLVVVTTLDGIPGIPKYEIYLDNLDDVHSSTNNKQAVIAKYPAFGALI
jgi:hypothetical protein